MNVLLLALSACSCMLSLLLFFVFLRRSHKQTQLLQQALTEQQQHLLQTTAQHSEKTLNQLHQFKHDISEKVYNQLQQLQQFQQQGQKLTQDTLRETFSHHTQTVTQRIERLIQTTEEKIQHINQTVEQRLNDGFAKTSVTFNDIAKRLILIDNAQQKITELSSNVVSLQEILSDKKARGTFGEIQLQQLIQNVLPHEHFAFQHSLSNGLRCDCMLFLPPPTGQIAIDSKFPLENFRRYTDHTAEPIVQEKALQAFRQDIRKHIIDIATKYIIPGETADGAIMFVPAESIFAEIHQQSGLIELAYQKRVWLASPTTMMAILTTASSVLKDTATRKHVHLIQQHLSFLAKDFERLNDRMSKLSKHIDQAQDDVRQVNTSAKKIAQRFTKIEQVDLTEPDSLQVEETPLL